MKMKVLYKDKEKILHNRTGHHGRYRLSVFILHKIKEIYFFLPKIVWCSLSVILNQTSSRADKGLAAGHGWIRANGHILNEVTAL